jgi:hypothetical protein
MNHYPKGGRCKGCAKRLHNCSALPFSTMPVHRQDGGDTVVICTEFAKAAPDSEVGRPFINPRRGRRL